jgi:hypothetical protein
MMKRIGDEVEVNHPRSIMRPIAKNAISTMSAHSPIVARIRTATTSGIVSEAAREVFARRDHTSAPSAERAQQGAGPATE